MLWAVLITYGLIGCSDRRFVTFPVGLVHQRLIDLKGDRESNCLMLPPFWG